MGSTGITENTSKRMLFGAGVWVRNYDKAQALSAQTANYIGATKGGNEFSIIQEIKNLGAELDDSKGPIKGMDHIIKDYATGKGTFADIALDTLLDKLPGATVSEVGNVATITRAQDVQDADYLTNIALVCDSATADGAYGFILNNPLSNEPLVIAPKRDDSATLDMAFESRYAATDMATAPWEILWESNAVVS